MNSRHVTSPFSSHTVLPLALFSTNPCPTYMPPLVCDTLYFIIVTCPHVGGMLFMEARTIVICDCSAEESGLLPQALIAKVCKERVPHS